LELRQEFRRDTFSIHNDSLHMSLTCCLLVPLEQGWQPNRQVLITPMGCREKWMTFSIMQDDQFAAAQDFAASFPDRSSGD
jgi:hypothetical protein